MAQLGTNTGTLGDKHWHSWGRTLVKLGKNTGPVGTHNGTGKHSGTVKGHTLLQLGTKTGTVGDKHFYS